MELKNQDFSQSQCNIIICINLQWSHHFTCGPSWLYETKNSTKTTFIAFKSVLKWEKPSNCEWVFMNWLCRNIHLVQFWRFYDFYWIAIQTSLILLSFIHSVLTLASLHFSFIQVLFSPTLLFNGNLALFRKKFHILENVLPLEIKEALSRRQIPSPAVTEQNLRNNGINH